MYSIKPGRGPSLMGAVGGIAAAVFGVVWIGMAMSMGAPAPFALFGVVFIVVASRASRTTCTTRRRRTA